MRQPRCNQHREERRFPTGCSVCGRIRIERTIVRKVVTSLVDSGWELWVDSGEDLEAPEFTRSLGKLFNALMECDEETIWARRGDETGWVALVYGNDGWDTVADFTLSLKHDLQPATQYADRLADRRLSCLAEIIRSG